jgi:hypothetical protein
MRVNAIAIRDHFGGGVSFGGGTRGCRFYISVLPQLFIHTIVWVYWLPKKARLLSNTETYNGCLMLHNCPLVLEQADDLPIHRFLPQRLDGVLWAATQ